MRISRQRLLLPIPLLLVAMGCGGGNGGKSIGQIQDALPVPTVTLNMDHRILLPGESMTVKLQSSLPQPEFSLSSTSGTITSQTSGTFTYLAPSDPGTYALQATVQGHPEAACTASIRVASVTVKVVGELSMRPSGAYNQSATLMSDGRILIDGLFMYPNAMIWDPASSTCSLASPCPIQPNFPSVIRLAGGSLAQVAGGLYPIPGKPDPKSIYGYDPALDKWSILGEMYYLSMGREGNVILKDGRLLSTGGLTGSGYSIPTYQIWDPSAGGIGYPAGVLRTARAGHSATLLPDGTVLLAGGSDGWGTFSSTEIIGPDLVSRSGAAMSVERTDHAALTLTGGQVLMVCGGYSSRLEYYDPKTGTFKPGAQLDPGVTKFPASAALPGGEAIIAGGGLPGPGYKSSDAIQLYSFALNEARTLAHMPLAIHGAAAVVGVDGIVYLFGGYSESSAVQTQVLAITVR